LRGSLSAKYRDSSHQDSLGNGSIISPGEIQKMSAGSGIMHSEYNASKEHPVHLLQIWIVPDKTGIKPAYEQMRFELNPGEWKLLGSPNGDGLVSIQQKIKLYGLSSAKNSRTAFSPEQGSKLWLQVVKGACSLNGTELNAGDGLGIHTNARIELSATEEAEVLLFEILSIPGQIDQ
jgi:redox-sensitive bicupin YhaK (pirin superfamily)